MIMPIKTPRPYQEEAISAVVSGLKSDGRGQLILPCGAGKTLVALWIAKKMKAKKILVIVPSLSLLKQIKDQWTEQGMNIPRISVCSEKDIDIDSISCNLSEISGNVSTNPIDIRNFINANINFIIYCTYQSMDKICRAIDNSNISFDITICDEAHRTAGNKKKISKFALIHSELMKKTKYKLFMTATPRIITDRYKSNNDIYSMDDQRIYGRTLFRMSFDEAIQQNILSDYKIITVAINKDDLFGIKEDINELNKFCYNYALEKFMKSHASTHVISYHSNISKSKEFLNNHKSISNIDIFHINGKMTSTVRKKILDCFSSKESCIITNSRCLTEGIDIPKIDGVFFCDPKNSKIDIIQAIGRALRKNSGNENKIGYIIVPLFHSSKNDIEKEIEYSTFSNLINIIRSLSEFDSNAYTKIYNDLKDGKKGYNNGKLIIEGISNEIDPDSKIRDAISFEILDKIKTHSSCDKYEFQEANNIVKKYNFSSFYAYHEAICSGMISNMFPYTPSSYKEWSGWSDYLGNNNICKMDRSKLFPSYEEASAMAKKHNFKKSSDYIRFVKSDGFPVPMPINASGAYKGKGWIDTQTFLGIPYKNSFLKYEELKKIVNEQNIQSLREYLIFRRSQKDIDKFPSSPRNFYSLTSEWKGWLNFLNREKPKRAHKRCLDYSTASKIAISLNISSRRNYDFHVSSKSLPKGMPASPHLTYKDCWMGWGHFLGKNIKRKVMPKHFTFSEAKKIIRNFNLTCGNQLTTLKKQGKLPIEIPSKPQKTYKNEWKGWNDFLGREKCRALQNSKS